MAIVSKISIKIDLNHDSFITLQIIPEKENTLHLISAEEANEYGEVCYQIEEGRNYEYSFSNSKCYISPIPRIITPFRSEGVSGGRITPGNFTGTLTLSLCSAISKEEIGNLKFEVRSVKTSYRDDYRFMMEEIAIICTDLVLLNSSPTTQYLSPSFIKDSQTLYQRFAFLKSLILSDQFQSSLRKIVDNPVVGWENEYISRDIRNIKKFGRNEIQQLVSSKHRIPINDFNLSMKFSSVPRKVLSKSRMESLDVPENQFIIHALRAMSDLLTTILHAIDQKSRDYKEASKCADILDDFLINSIWSHVSKPNHLNINSPVLQRKEGYREVYRTWLMFEIAAKLVWNDNGISGNDIYDAGKRDVAVLYEYWVFFQLLSLVSKIFYFPQKPISELIENTSDGLGLKLKTGKFVALEGFYLVGNRKMYIRFCYNKTFSGANTYPRAGSWTLPMRPDYTLSMWPSAFCEEEAELQELIIHLHFDAKYKVEGYSDLFAKTDYDIIHVDEETEESPEAKKARYKRIDILKMHAYKDAIRRTAGSYVLYPGTQNFEKRGYHEIIPGIGAFTLNPNRQDSGIEKLEKFIRSVLENFILQTSSFERMSYQSFRINSDRNRPNMRIQISPPEVETDSGKRARPPSEIPVLVGYQQEKQKNWEYSERIYNIRFNKPITPEMVGARYLLLYNFSMPSFSSLFEIKHHPEVWDVAELLKLGYPAPSQKEYFIYPIEKAEAFQNVNLDIHRIKNNHGILENDFSPFTVNLAEILSMVSNRCF